eukprot:g17305.t1
MHVWGKTWSTRQHGGSGATSRDGEREPLAPSGGMHSSGGAIDPSRAGGGSGSGARKREPKPKSPKGFLRGMMLPSRGKSQRGGPPASSTEMALSPSPTLSRGRAMTSAASTKPLDEAGVRKRAGLSPVYALERRSSAAGYEGLPAMPKPLPARDEKSNAAVIEGGSYPKRRSVRMLYEMSEEEALKRAVTFLEDALGYRDPNYYTDPRSIRSYRYRQSRAWQSCTSLAVVAYIAACFFGKPPFSADWAGMPPLSALQEGMGQTWGLCLECGCVLFFAFDMYLLCRCVGVRSIMTSWWKAAFLLSLLLSVADLTTRWYTHRPWSRVFRPAVFFFVGPKVRDCSLSTLHAVSALLPVLVLELLVTLAYSCVCVVLYHGVKDAPFTSLGSAFINLFALSTTVNDPDVWMPLYDRNRANVLVFASFLVVQVFLLHNILLASVWNEFGERMKTFAKQKRKWREESVRRAFEALDQETTGHITRDTVMRLLKTVRPHYGESKRYMMYERIVQSAGNRGRGGAQAAGPRGRVAKEYEAAEVSVVYRREFCSNVVEALSLKIRTIHERKIASMGQYLVFPLYVWNMAFVVISCAMSPWVFNTGIFWLTLLPTSVLLGCSVLAELVATGFRAYFILPWNRVKTLSLALTAAGLLWFIFFTSPGDWGSVFREERHGKKGAANVHMQVSIGFLMSARCMDLGTLLKLVPAIHDVVSVMYRVTPSVFAQAGVIFTLFHVYCYLGMALYGGVVTPGADFGDTPFANSPYYSENNFNSYPEGLVTLFELLVVNNWNMIITGYIHASPLGMWTYLYFLSFITLAVTLALNVLTAIFMTAFTTAAKSNHMVPATKGGGALGQSMTSDKARTALGAGASLALRPTPTAGSYFSSQSDLGTVGESGSSDATVRTRSYNIEEDEVLPITPQVAAAAAPLASGEAGGDISRTADVAGSGGGGSEGGRSLFNFKFASGVLGGSGSGKGAAGGRGSGGGGASGGGSRGDAADMPPPPPRPPSKEAANEGDESQASAAAAAARFPDPFQMQQSRRLTGLPENEEVVPESPRPSLDAANQDLDLGWGGADPLEPPMTGAGGRTRKGSGHYYKVSRRNSYSDRDMFEGGEDEEDVPMKILGAISVGLGNAMGIRACMLRHKEPRRMGRELRLKEPRPMGGEQKAGGERHGGGDRESSGEDELELELEYPESHLMYESSGFRRMVAPHLPIKQGGKALGLERDDDDECWEAMAMRDELTDDMLYKAFGDAILKECPPPALSPELGSSKSGTPGFGAKAKVIGASNAADGKAPPPASPRSATSEEDDDEEEDFDLPKDLGIRTWTKSLTKEERAQRMASSISKAKTTILSVQCVLAARKPVPVVVFTAKPVQ